MARNQEKAQTMLARFREAQAVELGLKRHKNARRPLPSSVGSVRIAERCRIEVVREISKKVSQIQNPALTEYQVRDLNDEINKLIREKGNWQNRILELGGRNYFTYAPQLDHEGKEIPGSRGYKYFGRAKDLPGVRELFDQMKEEAPKRTRHELSKSVDADYYGYRDDDDGLLAPLEKVAEEHAHLQATAEWQQKTPAEGDVPTSGSMTAAEQESIMPINIPTQKQVGKYLLDRRKRELLERYVSDDPQQ